MDELNPKTTSELIAALADGELDLAGHPEWAERLANEPGAMQQLAQALQMRKAVGSAMSGGAEMRCPDTLRSKVEAMSVGSVSDQSAAVASPRAGAVAPAHRPTVLARIGPWAPTAVAAVLLLAAGLVMMRANAPASSGAQAFVSLQQINTFTSRHSDCAMTPTHLKDHDRFGENIEQLPGELGDYFHQSADGLTLDLSTIHYRYEMTGLCSIPGRGAVHVIYRKDNDPEQAISLWIKPDDGSLEMEEGRVYVEAGSDLDHTIILWRSKGMLFFLMGDSLEDARQAVGQLRQAA